MIKCVYSDIKQLVADMFFVKTEKIMNKKKLQNQINEEALLREVVEDVKNEQFQQRKSLKFGNNHEMG